ncbi:prephenate dehydratase [Buchnera aphidicola (Diuraphis noxia)]|uniref:Bifunctional chorismate mutase/prephenate dehydratase n=1 Tax=Buchnera aphidicola subsp. Diuraphis noxia TaxID=118101 RepID=A0A1B2H8P8_BUCDN|nr:chorismate mutase [Buchnera aphidicola]ANZ22595.1 prephenate dehydratase [Buchnera aphidicola (Diuraphis noxia)]
MPTNSALRVFRDQINKIDEKIVTLLSQRHILVSKIAKSKIENNQSIRDIEREKKILQQLIFLGKEKHLRAEYITRLFQLIIEESVSIQKKILQKFYNNHKLHSASFSFLGPKGSYSHIAACKYADRNFKICITNECETFQNVITAVENNKSDYAVLPLENTCSGYINEVVFLLRTTNLFITGELNISINHCLLSTEDIALDKIKTVYSHSQPFQQCSDFIKKFPKWKIKYTKSTADAMKKIVLYNDPRNAALGSEIGSRIYGLKILSKNLSNKEKNITKFILLQKKPIEVSEKIPAKTTLIFTTGQKSEVLSKILLILQEKAIIMNKLTSHTIYQNLWEDMFYIEISANLSSTIIQETIKQIQNITKFCKILGCYPSEDIIPVVS